MLQSRQKITRVPIPESRALRAVSEIRESATGCRPPFDASTASPSLPPAPASGIDVFPVSSYSSLLLPLPCRVTFITSSGLTLRVCLPVPTSVFDLTWSFHSPIHSLDPLALDCSFSQQKERTTTNTNATTKPANLHSSINNSIDRSCAPVPATQVTRHTHQLTHTLVYHNITQPIPPTDSLSSLSP